MPSCAPDSMNDVRRVTSRALAAAESPASARAISRDRLTAVYANSCATKYAVKAVMRTTTATPRPMLASALSTLPPRAAAHHCGRPGLGRVFGVRARRYSLLPLVVGRVRVRSRLANGLSAFILRAGRWSLALLRPGR